MILRCSCSAPATHKVTITVAPVGATVPAARESGQEADVRWGYFSHRHIPTMARMKREYARVGLDVTEYEIAELIGT
jgi:hypothetical protein